MNQYEKLIDYANSQNVSVNEMEFSENLKGLYIDNNAFIESKLDSINKRCILAEELGHHYTGFGDIRNLPLSLIQLQERIGRRWSYQLLLPLELIVETIIREQPSSYYELAESLEVTEYFLKESLAYYKAKYGNYAETDSYKINLKTMEIDYLKEE